MAEKLYNKIKENNENINNEYATRWNSILEKELSKWSKMETFSYDMPLKEFDIKCHNDAKRFIIFIRQAIDKMKNSNYEIIYKGPSFVSDLYHDDNLVYKSIELKVEKLS